MTASLIRFGGGVELTTAASLAVSRLSDTSLRVAVAGDPTFSYQVYAVGPRLQGQVLLGTTSGGGTVTASGLVSGGDYLIWAAAVDDDTGAFVSGLAFAALSLADLDSVLAAFRRTFASSPAVQLVLTGGLWTNEVPEDVALPYGYMSLLGSRFLWTTEDFHVEVARVRLCVYALGAESTERTMKSVRSIFDWQDLQWSDSANSGTCHVMPDDAAVQSEFARHRSGAIVFQASVEYEVMIQRNHLSG